MFQRRYNFYVITILTVLLLVLAACGGAATPEQAPAEEPEQQAPAQEEEKEEVVVEEVEAPAGGATGQLEVFSWWTSGGEAAALDTLFEAYNANNPDSEIGSAANAAGGR